MGFCKFTKSGRPASVSGDRKSLSLRGAKRRGNPFFSCKETDSHASNAVTGAGMTGSGTSRTPSPTTAHRTHPQGGDAHTSPRRTNAHFAAGHMGPALQGTPVMQDGTSGTPSPTTVHRTHPQEDDAHTSPRRQHKEAGASACQLVEKVRMDFFGKLAGKIAK